MVDFSKVAGGLQKVLDGIQLVAPLAKSLGIPALSAIATLADAGATIGENALERIKEGAVVVDSRDETVIREIVKDLRAENNALMAEIDAS